MLTIITKKRWKAMEAERDALECDISTLWGRVTTAERTVKNLEKIVREEVKARQELEQRMRDWQQRVSKLEGEMKKERNRYGNTLAGKI